MRGKKSMQKKAKPETEAFLKALQESENVRARGRLKIFLGMAAGVGKTYAMLESAQKKVSDGVNVLVGIVNTHGREETAKLLEPLKQVPEKEIVYKDKTFKELDVDEIIRLKPQLALVDELAHTNVPGSKHLKRWQDVMEILDNGIDVYTTVNIQHIESYKDIVESITGIKIRETVPDLMLEQATSITCVDITPAELLQRLREGKVYTADLSEVALQNFFQEDRLTALREMALRCTAEVVDLELHEMVKAIQKGKGWKPRERLLVAINHHLYAQQLIRTTRRLSFALHAPWFAVYVDDGESLDETEQAILSKNLALARELGAEVITLQDIDIAEGIQKIAEQKSITQIIVGKSLRKRLFKRSPIDKLTKITSGIDVHIIRQSALFPHKRLHKQKKELKRPALSYLKVLFCVLLLSFFSASIASYVSYKVIAALFLLTILSLSLFFGIGPTFFSALLFALIWDFYFLPPLESFKVPTLEDGGFLILFVLSALIAGTLSERAKKREELLRKNEQSTRAIYEIVKEISAAPTSSALCRAVKEKLGTILKGTCEIIQRKNGGLHFEHATIESDEKEKAVADWVYKNGKPAGWSTSTLAMAKYLYIPLKGFKEVVGVLAFRSFSDKALLPEEANFLHTVAQQLSNFLERTFLEEQERKNALMQQMEHIHAKVLKSISDELSRPLKIIQNALTDFREDGSVTGNIKLFSSLQNIEKTSDSLMRIAENALAMAQLSSGVISFEKEAHDVDQLITTCIKKIEKSLKQHRLVIKKDEYIPYVFFDFSLMSILLHHLLMNAIEYSPVGSTIEIAVEVFDDTFVLSVSDEGKGIPEDMIELVFEKFYRLRGTASTGLGLGLAIVKSIAEMHHGDIRVQSRISGGTKFSLILPVAEKD